MSVEGWFALSVTVAVFIALAIGRWPAYGVLWSGLAALLVSGVVTVKNGLAGLANEGVITVAVLFIVAAGLRQTGALTFLVQRALGAPRSPRRAQLRMFLPVTLMSAVLNNTPVVAMLMPAILDWCKSAHIAPSKLLIPLSYTAILGGLCTTIGTSTNLVVNGLMIEAGLNGLRFFEIAWVGIPCVVVGALYLLVFAPKILPSRSSVGQKVPEDPREYVAEMQVAESLAGKSVQEAGLRQLEGLFLMEILRRDHVIPAVDPNARLETGDRLVFVGVVNSVVELQRIPGLLPVTQQVFKLDTHRAERCFVEAVISRTNPLVGQTIREGRFRNRYGAVVIAVSRNGERVLGRLGDIEIFAGDTLLLEARRSFVDQQRNSSDFFLVSQLDGEGPPTSTRAPVSILILVMMILCVAIGWLSMLQGALVAAALMIVTRCCSEETARRSVDWALLLSIAAAFGLGAALQESGVAAFVAQSLLGHVGKSPHLALILVYVTTAVLTEFVTNNAAAVIVFPIALSTAQLLGVDPTPFLIAVMVGASASFATPLGYQTNLMVYGPGGYRFADFAKVGLPMNVLVGVVTCTLTPLFWPF